MAESITTRPSLLIRLRNTDDAVAWNEFVQLYGPLIYRFGRKCGFQDADSADVTQEVLRGVARSIGRWQYDPDKGAFRSWLFTVARNKMKNLLDAQKRNPRGSGDTGVREIIEKRPDARDDLQSDWDLEYERRVFEWAAESVRKMFQDKTWQAFWATAVDGRSPEEVARELGMSPGAVYIAKSRVQARLREKIQQEIGDR